MSSKRSSVLHDRRPVWPRFGNRLRQSFTSVPQFVLSKFPLFGTASDLVTQIPIARRQGLVERLTAAIHLPIPDRFLWKACGAGTTASGSTSRATSGLRSRSTSRASVPSPRWLTWRMALVILMSKRTRCEAGLQNERLPPVEARMEPECRRASSPDSMFELSHPSVTISGPRVLDVDPRRGRCINRASARSSSPM